MSKKQPGPKRAKRGIISTLILVIALVAAERYGLLESGGGEAAVAAEDRGGSNRELAELVQARRSGEMVSVQGKVDRVLSDDNDGSRHQRFVLRVSGDSTVLVAHNIDLAERVPLERGDTVLLRGQYEWNDKGGVLHWTHHDPGKRHPEGWIEHEGKRYE